MIKLAPIIVGILIISLNNAYPIMIEITSSTYLYGASDEISVALAAPNVMDPTVLS